MIMLLQPPETPFVSAVYVEPEQKLVFTFKKKTGRETDVFIAKYFPVPTANPVSPTDHKYRKESIWERENKSLLTV